jgi:hypothetical protein
MDIYEVHNALQKAARSLPKTYKPIAKNELDSRRRIGASLVT